MYKWKKSLGDALLELRRKRVAKTSGEYYKNFQWRDNRNVSMNSKEELLQGLKDTLDWILVSQSSTKDGGSSAGFYITTKKWLLSYPETTGYLIPTLLNASSMIESMSERLSIAAIEMSEWLLELQNESGAWNGGVGITSRNPSIFNTGQIIQGLNSAFIYTNEEKYQDAAFKGALWMARALNENGEWNNYIHDLNCRSYYSRAAWPMIKIGLETIDMGGIECIEAGQKYLEWVKGNQNHFGFIERSGFLTDGTAGSWNTLHTIAYTIEGILESGLLLDDRVALRIAAEAGDKLREIFNQTGHIPAELSNDWSSNSSYLSITGMAQTSLIWGRLCQQMGQPLYLKPMQQLLASLRSIQVGRSYPINIRGSFPGSIPIWAKYQPNMYINWAAKFFCDATITQIECMQEAIDSHAPRADHETTQ